MSDFNVDFDQLKNRKIENGDIIPMGSDAEYHAEFTIERVPNFEGTDFTEVEHLKLQAPGNTKSIYHQPVRHESAPGRPSDPERFPREWAAFKAGQTIESGLSIYEWQGCTANDARRFDLQGIKTVQQLAAVSDGNLQGLGVGAMALREQARAFLNGNTNEVQLRQQLGDQAEQIKKLTDILEGVMSGEITLPGKGEEQPAKGGRKTKETVDG